MTSRTPDPKQYRRILREWGSDAIAISPDVIDDVLAWAAENQLAMAVHRAARLTSVSGNFQVLQGYDHIHPVDDRVAVEIRLRWSDWIVEDAPKPR